MRGIRTIVAVAAMAAAAVAFGPSATAQQNDVVPVFKIAPNVLAKGQNFQAQVQEGTCPGGLESVTSAGFLEPVGPGDLVVTGTAGEKPGKFTATAKCKGSTKTGTAEFEVLNRNINPKFEIVPSALRPGQKFEVRIEEGDCPEGATLYSDGFYPKTMHGLHGTAGFTPGKYQVRLSCGSDPVYGNSTEIEILAVAPHEMFTFDKEEYAPGEKIIATAPVSANCVGELTSNGLVAPITLSREGDKMIGIGKAVDKPGTYEAAMKCGDIFTGRELTIKGKAPVVKPKGAPQTGGGGTA
ncbi:hypothetical protein [Lentzea sp. NPDC051838]|uniref:hypothetical protein n=1 Tax=Lentzea sp. NPDC051838 TaxID=3154849 RepID=UPI00344AE682